MSKIAHILCARISAEVASLMPNGVANATAIHALEPHLWFGPRPYLETLTATETGFPEFVQFIPYIVVRYRGKVLHYVRPAGGGEERLHGKLSIGIGGHVDAADACYNDQGQIDLLRTLITNALREIAEEIGIHIHESQINWAGTLYLQNTPVDLLHICAIGLIELTDEQYAQLSGHEAEVHNLVFALPGDKAAVLPAGASADDWSFETWSDYLVNSDLIDSAVEA